MNAVLLDEGHFDIIFIIVFFLFYWKRNYFKYMASTVKSSEYGLTP